MKSIAIIPLRKGSKGIPGKNKKKFLGKPLFTWVLGAAITSDLDEIYIATDDEEIRTFVEKEYHWCNKVSVYQRSSESASDTASTEMVMQEFVEQYLNDWNILCLLQATSPLTTKEDINQALQQIKSGKDSAISMVKTHRFIWDANGMPINYQITNRPRRQDFEGLWMENGAVYATSAKAWNENAVRISGSIGFVEMKEDTLIEIDSQSDWEIAERLLQKKLQSNRMPSKIKYLVLDVDGVFTDGTVYYDANGEAMKRFDMRDGMGLEILRQYGVEVMVITSENSALVQKRMEKLQIKTVFIGVKDKYNRLQHFFAENIITWNEVAYIGDDVNDMPCLCASGWSFTPQNATNSVKSVVDIVLNKNSGNGAIREAVEWVLKYNQRF